jgi:hypothetical protein
MAQRAIQLRGEPQTMACPVCAGQHASIARIEGMAVLVCADVTPPGAMRMHRDPGFHGRYYILVGAEPEPEPASEPATPSRTRRPA